VKTIMRRIYLDHNASTPVHPEVVAAMLPYFSEQFGNASSIHSFGRDARDAVEAAREAGLGESHHAETFEDTVALLLKRLAPGDAVLIKGSRGMRMERVVDALMARFGGEDG